MAGEQASGTDSPINHVYKSPARTTAEGRKFLMAYPRTSFHWKVLSRLTVFSVGLMSKLFLKFFHKIEIHDEYLLHNAFKQAEVENRGIITVMNHVSVLDDPLIWGGTLPLSILGCPGKMRWTLGAKDICFKNWKEALFFSLGQVLSVERFGKGPDQPAIDAAIELLSQGKWIHIYPEGFVHQPYDPFEGTLRYFHWGISRLILESGPNPPIVLPIYGKGLQTVFPEDKAKKILGYRSREPIVYSFGSPLDVVKLSGFRERYRQLASEAKGEVTADVKKLRSEVAGFVRKAVINAKGKFAKELDNDADPRLENPSFWKTQTLIKLKGRTMEEKLKKGTGAQA